MEDYSMLLQDAIEKNKSIVFGCKCEIAYSGRAESFLPEGDRIVFIKEDNALLVHQPTGNAPVNYMKPGCSHSVALEDRHCILHTKHMTAKEFMNIKMSKIYFFQAYKLQDGRALELKGTEKDMADMIMRQPNLIEEGFTTVNQEEQTKYGFVDILGYDKQGVLTVVECKRYTADLAAVTQLRRYVEKIKASKGIAKIRGIIAAPKMSSNAAKMLQDWGFTFVSLNAPKYLERFDKLQQKLHHFG